jgi:hypothetical protein
VGAHEEFWDQATATEVLPFLDEVTALAGRAGRLVSACTADLPVAVVAHDDIEAAARPGCVGERSWIEEGASVFAWVLRRQLVSARASQQEGCGLLKVTFPGRGGHLGWGRLQAADLGGPWGGGRRQASPDRERWMAVRSATPPEHGGDSKPFLVSVR